MTHRLFIIDLEAKNAIESHWLYEYFKSVQSAPGLMFLWFSVEVKSKRFSPTHFCS